MLVGAYRPHEIRAGIAASIADLATAAELVALQGLSAPEVEDLVRAVAGTPAAGWARLVHDRSGGHPFFARELCHLLVAGGTPTQVPAVVREAIGRRLANLSTPCLGLLDAAAATGIVLPDVLADVSGADAARIAELIAEAAKAGMLSPADATNAIRFTHDLYRETIYASLALAQRLDLHHRIAAALLRRRERGSSVLPAELARHFAAAVSVAGSAPAVAWAQAAADADAIRFAFADAAGHLSRARSVIAEACQRLADNELVGLLTAEADLRLRGGDAVQARELLDSAWTRATSTGQPERFLVVLAARTPLLAGITERAYIDIDSLLRPVYGKAKQGASFGHTKLAGKSILRRGLSPLAVTISTDTAAPVLAGVRLRAGRAGSAKGAASMLTEAINTAIEAGAQPQHILVRGDTAYCAGKIVASVVRAGATFSFAIARNPAVDAAIASIADDAFVPVQYPDAVTDPDTGELISDAHVAEVPYTAFADTRYEITAWLVVRRVLDANTQDPLLPVWRYHPFFTNSAEPVAQADITHRAHAIVETVWSDLIDGPWAHQPSGSFAANAAWTVLAAITHNLLRAAGTVTEVARYAVARGATLRTHLINVAARFARPQRRLVLHLPHWPRADIWLAFWRAVFGT